MALFLAKISEVTKHTNKLWMDYIRLVEAENEKEAEELAKAAYADNHEDLEVSFVNISPVIKKA